MRNSNMPSHASPANRTPTWNVSWRRKASALTDMNGEVMKRIYITAYNTYIYEWERKYEYPDMEYDMAHSLRLVEPDRDGNDPDDPCAEDLRKDMSLQRKM
jgi:hypothetical protein